MTNMPFLQKTRGFKKFKYQKKKIHQCITKDYCMNELELLQKMEYVHACYRNQLGRHVVKWSPVKPQLRNLESQASYIHNYVNSNPSD